MSLPNYFLADLPPEATLSPSMITEACQTLKQNREKYLLHRSTQSLVQAVSSVAADWLEADYPFRKLALEQAAAIGFSRGTLTRGLDGFFKHLKAEDLQALLEQDLGHSQRLDTFSSTQRQPRRAAIARGPEFLVHVNAGGVPNPALLGIVFGVLLRSAHFVKSATGASFLPRLFAHSIYEVEPKLGACLEIAEWRGGNLLLEKALLDEADCVVASGTDETIDSIRKRVPLKARLVVYGHRVSFAFISAGVQARTAVARAADDVVAWNQLGCLSPHVIYVEGAGAAAEQFADALAGELARREESEPRGALPAEVAATIASRRAFYEVRAAHSPDTRLWCSKDSTAWTVLYEADPRFQLSCLNRFIYVKGAVSLKEVLQSADAVRGKVSTVGLAAPEESVEALAGELANWGVTRICPLGQMQDPPLTWRHDGRPALGDLVMWTDWEK